jgi:hypothetical protein
MEGRGRKGTKDPESEKPPEPEGSSGLSSGNIRHVRDPCQIERARRFAAQAITSSAVR